MQTDLIFGLVILIFSVILHEVAHGYMANWLGDPTARLQGRLTLNPLKHIDPLGTIMLPAILLLTQAPILIGYAKPVPYNPYNLRGRFGEVLVAFAGPGTNILLALIFGLIVRFFGASLDPSMLMACATITYINMLLALFNIIPIPPLDGSKILSGILPPGLARSYDSFRTGVESLGILSGTFLILFIFYFFSSYFSAFLQTLFGLLTGATI
ncbi:site-2 protease family protein [Patescibacteria group bacterium]|nr:MAG: site-2 protease family protein [Patescibacteria group bacterium]